jgi:hypothetical protein
MEHERDGQRRRGEPRKERSSMRGKKLTILTLLPLFLLVGACDDEEIVEVEDFDLTVEGDATFNQAHGGQAIAVALVSDDGNVLETMEGTVSASEDPSFSFTFEGILVAGESYSVDYWIDSNFGGGTAGECDPIPVDHQWRLSVFSVADHVVLVEDHEPQNISNVCDSF